jgi:pimeloyl-ACP methyl ester carboxylesterase
MSIFDAFWHKTLRRPYRLARTVDQGKGIPVVLLHGIGRSGQVWQHVVELLADRPYRAVAFDLLGFGASPKPDWVAYSIDDHAAAVIASIERLGAKQPVVLVGHSMGCLVAARVARLRPDLVRHLVLYEMPLYDGLPEKKRYRWRIDMYYKFYQRIIRYQPTFNDQTAKLAERLATRIVGFEINPATWQPFIRSLEHTILGQTTASDLKQIVAPADIIYGSYDMFVIRGKPQQTFGSDNTLVNAHTIRARHEISVKASKFIVERIDALERPQAVAPSKRPLKKVIGRAKRARKIT